MLQVPQEGRRVLDEAEFRMYTSRLLSGVTASRPADMTNCEPVPKTSIASAKQAGRHATYVRQGAVESHYCTAGLGPCPRIEAGSVYTVVVSRRSASDEAGVVHTSDAAATGLTQGCRGCGPLRAVAWPRVDRLRVRRVEIPEAHPLERSCSRAITTCHGPTLGCPDVSRGEWARLAGGQRCDCRRRTRRTAAPFQSEATECDEASRHRRACAVMSKSVTGRPSTRHRHHPHHFSSPSRHHSASAARPAGDVCPDEATCQLQPRAKRLTPKAPKGGEAGPGARDTTWTLDGRTPRCPWIPNRHF